MTKVLNLKHSDDYLEDYTNEELHTLIEKIEKAKSPKFKVGDWVVHSNTVYNYIKTTTVGWFLTQLGNEIENKYSRLATEEEIEKAIKEQGKGYFVYNNQLCKLTKIHKNLEDKIFLYVEGNQFNSLYVNNCRLPTDEELKLLKSTLPKSWDEAFGNIKSTPFYNYIKQCTFLRESKYYKTLIKYHKLIILRDIYRDSYKKGWTPDWESIEDKYVIEHESSNKLSTTFLCHTPRTFSFPTFSLRDKFLDNFREELEEIIEFL